MNCFTRNSIKPRVFAWLSLLALALCPLMMNAQACGPDDGYILKQVDSVPQLLTWTDSRAPELDFGDTILFLDSGNASTADGQSFPVVQMEKIHCWCYMPDDYAQQTVAVVEEQGYGTTMNETEASRAIITESVPDFAPVEISPGNPRTASITDGFGVVR